MFAIEDSASNVWQYHSAASVPAHRWCYASPYHGASTNAATALCSTIPLLQYQNGNRGRVGRSDLGAGEGAGHAVHGEGGYSLAADLLHKLFVLRRVEERDDGPRLLQQVLLVHLQRLPAASFMSMPHIVPRLRRMLGETLPRSSSAGSPDTSSPVVSTAKALARAEENSHLEHNI
eukprot:3868846-Rhodomonas_salina.3